VTHDRVTTLERVCRLASIAGVVVAALSLAILWVFLVPIFEASDESDHFDYVISVARAGHLLAAQNPPGFPAADLETDFLETYTDFPRINLNLNERVAGDYGTYDYFNRINRRSEEQLPDMHAYFQALDHPNPTLVPFYPFGYYAANAAWLWLYSQFDHRLAAIFFAARLFSVALLALTLAACYGIARELGVRRRVSIGLTAIVGMFPLTTFVASYVQPDNLTLALESSVLYLALRFKRARGRRTLALLGVALGYLAVTKYQNYLCTVIAVAPLVLLLIASRSASLYRRAADGATFVLPSVIFFTVQYTIVGTRREFANQESSHFYAFTGLANFPAELALFIVRLGQGIWYLFIGNIEQPLTSDKRFAASVGYWGNFGWLDAPLTFGNAMLDLIVHRLIQSLTALVIVLTLIWLSRTATRLARLVRLSRYKTALRLALNNVLLNTYFVFVLFMIIFYALTNNAWHMSGRNWHPLIISAMLLAFHYAPRGIRNTRIRRRVGAGIFSLLALYVAFGSVYAVRTVQQRYYGPERVPLLSSLKRGPNGDITVEQVDSQGIGANGLFVAALPHEPCNDLIILCQHVQINGWATDVVKKTAAGGVVAFIDGRDEIVGSYGYAKEFVAKALRRNSYFWSGFEVSIPTSQLGFGLHHISFDIVSHDFTTYYPTHRIVNVLIVPAPERQPVPFLGSSKLTGYLDWVGSARHSADEPSSNHPVWLDNEDRLFLRGWGFDPVLRARLARVDIWIDGHRASVATLNRQRDDVSRAFPALPLLMVTFSGFSATVPLRTLGTGPHSLTLTGTSAGASHPLVLIRNFPFSTYAVGKLPKVVVPFQTPLPIIDSRPKTVKPQPALLRPPALPMRFRRAPRVSGYLEQVRPMSGAYGMSWKKEPIRLPSYESLFMRGWALNVADAASSGQLYVVVDGTSRFAAHTGQVRPDVAKRFPALPAALAAEVGFTVVVPMRSVGTGSHRFDLRYVNPTTGHESTLIYNFPFEVF